MEKGTQTKPEGKRKKEKWCGSRSRSDVSQLSNPYSSKVTSFHSLRWGRLRMVIQELCSPRLQSSHTVATGPLKHPTGAAFFLPVNKDGEAEH